MPWQSRYVKGGGVGVARHLIITLHSFPRESPVLGSERPRLGQTALVKAVLGLEIQRHSLVAGRRLGLRAVPKDKPLKNRLLGTARPAMWSLGLHLKGHAKDEYSQSDRHQQSREGRKSAGPVILRCHAVIDPRRDNWLHSSQRGSISRSVSMRPWRHSSRPSRGRRRRAGWPRNTSTNQARALTRVSSERRAA